MNVWCSHMHTHQIHSRQKAAKQGDRQTGNRQRPEESMLCSVSHGDAGRPEIACDLHQWCFVTPEIMYWDFEPDYVKHTSNATAKRPLLTGKSPRLARAGHTRWHPHLFCLLPMAKVTLRVPTYMYTAVP